MYVQVPATDGCESDEDERAQYNVLFNTNGSPCVKREANTPSLAQQRTRRKGAAVEIGCPGPLDPGKIVPSRRGHEMRPPEIHVCNSTISWDCVHISRYVLAHLECY